MFYYRFRLSRQQILDSRFHRAVHQSHHQDPKHLLLRFRQPKLEYKAAQLSLPTMQMEVRIQLPFKVLERVLEELSR